MTPNEEQRLAYVDSLRAIAAILVLWQHVSELFVRLNPEAMPGRWLYELAQRLNFGRIGVVAFFAISGFVVPFSIKLDHRYPVREFLLKRFLRIYPAYWLSVPIGIVTTYWLWGRHFSVGDFLVNLTILEYIFDVQPAIGLYWTLAVEVVFYACCALLVLSGSVTRYGRIAWLTVALLGVHVGLQAALGSRLPSIHGAWFLNLGVMFWGMLWRASQKGRVDPLLRMIPLAIGVFIVAVYPLIFRYVLEVPFAYTVPYSLGVALFVVATRWVRVSVWPFPWLGTISYSLYLFHPVVFSPILRVLQSLPKESIWRNLNLGIYIAAVLAISTIVAATVYRWVEKPSIELARRLAKRWFGGGKRTPAVGLAAALQGME
jgi:peptidoglycan/LPS O-acetylase OafA/YrhL